jgi:hypothetical protein
MHQETQTSVLASTSSKLASASVLHLLMTAVANSSSGIHDVNEEQRAKSKEMFV